LPRTVSFGEAAVAAVGAVAGGTVGFLVAVLAAEGLTRDEDYSAKFGGLTTIFTAAGAITGAAVTAGVRA